MPRNGSGTYSLPQPAFVPGTTISSSAVNSDFSDIASALTASIAADGQTPITGGLKITAGTAALPALAFITDNTTGLYLASAGNLGLAASGVTTITLSGTNIGVSDNILLYANGAIPCPVGTIIDWPGVSAPTGWLLLYGQVVAQATYPGLYAIISTTYNTGGEGAGNFRLPDCRGRIGVGKDDMGGSAANRITNAVSGITGTTLGANGGEQGHTLVTGEIPAHNHTATDSGHTHGLHVSVSQAFTGGAAGASSALVTPNAAGTAYGNTDSGTANVTTANTGGGGAHNNVQPAIIFNKIIFAGR